MKAHLQKSLDLADAYVKRYYDDSYWMITRREGAMMATEVFIEKHNLRWPIGGKRYYWLTNFFKWWSNSKIGRWFQK